MESVAVIKIGTTITTNIGKIEAIITGIIIRDKSIFYECGYFNNGDYKICTLSEDEFNCENKYYQLVGFK